MDDLISRQAAFDALDKNHILGQGLLNDILDHIADAISALPSAQPEYEPVKAEDFAKTMSENTLYSFMAWYGEALELMGRQGFVICKKTM